MEAQASSSTKGIKTPMSLELMREKLETQQYSTLESFDADMQLMFDNCIKCWGRASIDGKVRREIA